MSIGQDKHSSEGFVIVDGLSQARQMASFASIPPGGGEGDEASAEEIAQIV
jgi:hypothetical protein